MKCRIAFSRSPSLYLLDYAGQFARSTPWSVWLVVAYKGESGSTVQLAGLLLSRLFIISSVAIAVILARGKYDMTISYVLPSRKYHISGIFRSRKFSIIKFSSQILSYSNVPEF